ncbi:unnamed protein product [Protopolystoma xenopodis]|uniref:Uncharacterized protein n=1 Tax=Protopolystoma xenopodis TaxID=117903 RepID=A0A3S5CRA3_9PLAT|nr:unnamed protein product [Protopolystoma xenopodis]
MYVHRYNPISSVTIPTDTITGFNTTLATFRTTIIASWSESSATARRLSGGASRSSDLGPHQLVLALQPDLSLGLGSDSVTNPSFSSSATGLPASVDDRDAGFVWREWRGPVVRTWKMENYLIRVDRPCLRRIPGWFLPDNIPNSGSSSASAESFE